MELAITPSAAKFISRMIRFNGTGPESGFRLSVSPGGCSGLSSEFTVEAGPLDGDALIVVDGVRLFLPAESRILLHGATIDFADTAMSTGLTFKTATPGSCGCSSSSSSSTESSGSCSSSAGSTAPSVASVAISSIGRKA